MRPPTAASVATALMVISACEEAEILVDRYRDLTPHEAYRASLEAAGLSGTALGRSWDQAARLALERPGRIDLPHREEGWLPPEDPSAVGLRFTLRRGQVLRARAALAGGQAEDSTRLFLELFRVAETGEGPPRPVQRADTVDGALVYEPYREGDYLVRLQPELLRGGRYRLTLSIEPALAFPVEGHTDDDVHSFFGADRDGGARRHHGVDIFAPRGTPVVAAAEGEVRGVRVTGRGGRVVWLRDHRRNQSLYYAHLDRQLVRNGQQVRVGDTLGLVGNTGNARSTPPHLHFGIYRRGEGPVDPITFIRRPERPPPALPGDPGVLGAWERVRPDSVPLRPRPDRRASPVRELTPEDPLRVVAGAGGWLRVRTADGDTGWLPAASLVPSAERG